MLGRIPALLLSLLVLLAVAGAGRRARAEDARSVRVLAAANEAPTELYVPRLQYQAGYWAEVSSGEIEHDLPGERVLWVGAEPGEQWLTLRRAPVEEEDDAAD